MDGGKGGQRQVAKRRQRQDTCPRAASPPLANICSDLKVNYGIWMFYFPSCSIITIEPKV